MSENPDRPEKPDPHATPTAVILAAGRGRRMGGPKALLRYRGEPLAVHAARSFREAGCPTVVVVLGAGADEAEGALRALPGVRTVRIPDPDAPMFASIQAGLAAAPDAPVRGALLQPVDAPRVSPAAIGRLLRRVAEHATPLPDAVVAAFGEHRGHPVWVAPSRIAELRGAPADHPDGLRGWMREHRWRIESVDTEDPSVLDDIDTPEDLHHVR